MNRTFKLFIGSNNKTGKLEKKKILKTALKYSPQGFTYYEGFGVYKSKTMQCEEKCGIIEILNKKSIVKKLTKELKVILKQESIYVQELQAVSSFV